MEGQQQSQPLPQRTGLISDRQPLAGDPPQPSSYQIRSVEGAPDDEGPVGAVPEAAQQEDDGQVEEVAAQRDPIAAQRYVDVVPEPGGERDVPAGPELGDRLGQIGSIEVLHQLDAVYTGDATGDVRVA